MVGSTNAVAMRHALDGDPPGLVVVADHQTEGRGRRGRAWEDEPGRSLLLSALVEARFAEPTLVPLATGLAVVDALREIGLDPGLKWPNDVLLDGRKCAGILVEAVQEPPRVVLGIGLNVYPQGEEDEADRTSVAGALGRDVNRWMVLGHLLTALDRRLWAAEQRPAELLERYRVVCSTLGVEVEVGLEDGVLVGTAEDVDASGALVLRTGERAVVVRAGDVTHVRSG